jgi:hypothetical protein
VGIGQKSWGDNPGEQTSPEPEKYRDPAYQKSDMMTKIRQKNSQLLEP